MTEPARRYRKSEAARLRDRRCSKCGGTAPKTITNITGMYEDEPDPEVLVSFNCPDELCEVGGPGF